MNIHAVRAIYSFEMGRMWRTMFQSIASPVISTSLYFIVFGSAIGSRMTTIDGVPYGAFIIPGLVMLQLLTQSITNASFGIYLPRFTGTIYETPVGAHIRHRGASRLCRRRRQQIHHPRPHHPGDGAPVRLVRHRASVLDAGLPRPDLSRLQPVRLRPRHLGGRLRETSDRAADGHHAADVPGRHVLLDQHAAAVLADRSACSIRWSIWSTASAGPSMASPTSTSASASP